MRKAIAFMTAHTSADYDRLIFDRHPAVKIKIASIREVAYAIAVSGNEPLPRAAYFLVRISQPLDCSDRRWVEELLALRHQN